MTLLNPTSRLPARIICLTGRNGVGKSSLARHLARTRHFRRYSFAEPVKTIANLVAGIKPGDEYLKNKRVGYLGLTPREAWIKVGQGMKDLFGDSVWAHCMANRIREQKAPRIVIDDLGFPEELEALRSINLPLTVIRVVQPETFTDRPANLTDTFSWLVSLKNADPRQYYAAGGEFKECIYPNLNVDTIPNDLTIHNHPGLLEDSQDAIRHIVRALDEELTQ